MTTWTTILLAALVQEVRGIKGKAPTLSHIIRKLPLRIRWALWFWLAGHFLRKPIQSSRRSLS